MENAFLLFCLAEESKSNGAISQFGQLIYWKGNWFQLNIICAVLWTEFICQILGRGECCHLNVNAHPDPFELEAEASSDVISCVVSIFDAGCSCGTKNWPQENDDDKGRKWGGVEARAWFDSSWVSKIWRCIKLRLGRKCEEKEVVKNEKEMVVGESVQHKTSRRVVCLSNVNDVI